MTILEHFDEVLLLTSDPNSMQSEEASAIDIIEYSLASVPILGILALKTSKRWTQPAHTVGVVPDWVSLLGEAEFRRQTSIEGVDFEPLQYSRYLVSECPPKIA